jgi:glycerol-3-phosphate dehydrogenase
MIYDVVIVGGGVIGGMVARELSKYELSVCILEKENDIAMGASKANSGIVHGGYDPEPETLKARLNSIGVEKLFKAAKELNVPIKNNGSLVCAFSKEEEATIEELYQRGITNNINGLSIISGEKAREIEPRLSKSVVSALLVENAGIVCPYELTVASIGNAMDNGISLIRNFAVKRIEKKENIVLYSKNGDIAEGKYVINCAGGYSGKIAEMLGDNGIEIIPRAGEYLLLDKTEGASVKHTIFQVPTKEGKGILVSPTVDGNLLTGPTALVVNTPDSTNTTQSGLNNVKKLSLKSIPDVNFGAVITSFTGVRSSCKGGDFIIEPSKTHNAINVAAIDSPGLTCCVAIAEYVVNLLSGLGAKLTKKSNWISTRENPHKFREMTDDEKNEYIKSHKDFGHIICRCEGVSEGEIREAVRRNPKALDVDSVKRRTRSGMGRCQGGFCMPYVMKIISEETGIPMTEVTKNGQNSRIVTEKL